MKIVFLSLGLFSVLSFAATTTTPRKMTAELQNQINQYNRDRSLMDEEETNSTPLARRPFAEYEKAGYLLISGEFSFGSQTIKTELVKNLPAGMKAIILVDNDGEAESLRRYYSTVVKSETFRIVKTQRNPGFWARDSYPIPVFTEDSGGSEAALVNAKYGHGNEPDAEIAKLFQLPLFSHSYYYEGGNFIADTKGNCALVDRKIPDQVFTQYYGCKNVLRLPQTGGIGHIDERVKFLSDKVAVTDTQSYVKDLEELGYEVMLLPRTGTYETYVNSLLVNGTIFMPVFGRKTDDEAAEKVYEDLGFKVIALNSKNLSNNGLGSIHCITMTYPELKMEKVLEAF